MRFIFLIMSFWGCLGTQGQMRISGKIVGQNNATKLAVNTPHSNWIHPQNEQAIPIDKNGSFSAVIPIKKPQTFLIKWNSKNFQLYGEPGKDLSIVISGDTSTQFQFDGALKNENALRQELELSRFELVTPMDDSASPEQILKNLQQQQTRAFSILRNNKRRTTPAFQQITFYDIAYFPASRIWQAIWDKGINSTSFTNLDTRTAWMNTLLSAHTNLKISNDSAIHSYHYQQIISYYPKLLERKFSDKAAFEKLVTQLANKPFQEALQEIRAKGKDYWEYTVYNKTLEGLARESALANFLVKNYQQGEFSYLREGFQHFSTAFPSSSYLPELIAEMSPYFASIESQASDSGIHFEPAIANYSNLDTIIAQHKGKVVYVDLWGTWCGPCREEFAHNKQLKERFKNKGVDFLYLASEHRSNPEQYWKEMIRFYGVKGRHFIIGPLLEKYFRELYEKDGSLVFPSYLLFDKNGRLVTTKAKRPSEKESLYAQIDELL